MHLCRQVQLGCIENTQSWCSYLVDEGHCVSPDQALFTADFTQTHTYAHSISLSHFESHSLWHILISVSLSLTRALLDCDVSSSLGLPAVLAHLEVRHTVGGRDRSDRTTHAGWDRSTRAVSHETVPQALKISLKSKSKAEHTESRRAEYADSQNREELNRENYTIHTVPDSGALRDELDFYGYFFVLIHLYCY